MSAVKLKKIVFVCTGNTCRSPMAEYILRKKLKERKLRGFKVTSAGIAAKKGDAINPKSAQVLAEKGMETASFKVSSVTDKLLRDSFVFVCMTERHKDYLMDMRWNALRKAGVEEIENNVFSFRELVGYEIPDPYGMDIEKYEYVYRLLEGGMSAIIDRLGLSLYALPTKPKTPSLNADGTPKKRGRPKKMVKTEQLCIKI